MFSGNVPQGAGMSSSAALECGTCFGLNELFKFNIPKLEMVKISQLAEHNYAGVQCGIMDQFASVMGKADQALLLDCKTLDFKYFPIELRDYSLLLCNSNVSHNLATSEYNIRRQQCEEGVRVLNTKFDEIESLRDVSMEQLEDVKSQLDPIGFLRCKYVIEENIRVHRFSNALVQKVLVNAGNILQEAHRAMRHEYEITCPEIDLMADYANNHPDVLGARMMGGGFGGCTINLIRKGKEDKFVSGLQKIYQKNYSKEITPIKVVISDGVSIIEEY